MKAYKVQRELSKSFEKSNITGVCDTCALGLRQTVEVKNRDQTSVMEVRDLVYGGPLVNTPMSFQGLSANY